MLRFQTLLLTLASVAAAQSPDSSRRAAPLAAVTITATRTARSTFDTPQPVTVFDSAQLAESHANGVADLFRGVAGLDASGVGPNQRRPEIRGQRGQRILLLGDGLRLNNSRRQQDFGELPAVLGFSSIERVEVVRGPSSVLYGTDAIGGVVNLISAGVPRGLPSGDVRGAIRYRYGSVGSESTPDLSLMSRFGKFGVLASAEYRDANEYSAPSGSFGNITLNTSAVVHGSGVRDHAAHAALTYDLTTTGALFARVDAYSARNAGFGYVDPSLLGAAQPKIQIQYPAQDYTRYTAGYRDRALALVVADRVDVSAYVQRDERHLDQNIFIPITPTANVTATSFNFTGHGHRRRATRSRQGTRRQPSAHVRGRRVP
jgi:outer membrane receptor protein involved in Fe transport